MSIRAMVAMTSGRHPLDYWAKKKLIAYLSDNKTESDLEYAKELPLIIIQHAVLVYAGKHHVGNGYEFIKFYKLRARTSIKMGRFEQYRKINAYKKMN